MQQHWREKTPYLPCHDVLIDFHPYSSRIITAEKILTEHLQEVNEGRDPDDRIGYPTLLIPGMTWESESVVQGEFQDLMCFLCRGLRLLGNYRSQGDLSGIYAQMLCFDDRYDLVCSLLQFVLGIDDQIVKLGDAFQFLFGSGNP